MNRLAQASCSGGCGGTCCASCDGVGAAATVPEILVVLHMLANLGINLHRASEPSALARNRAKLVRAELKVLGIAAARYADAT